MLQKAREKIPRNKPFNLLAPEKITRRAISTAFFLCAVLLLDGSDSRLPSPLSFSNESRLWNGKGEDQE